MKFHTLLAAVVIAAALVGVSQAGTLTFTDDDNDGLIEIPNPDYNPDDPDSIKSIGHIVSKGATITVDEVELKASFVPTPRTDKMLPVLLLVGKSEEFISENFAKPDSCGENSFGRKCKYHGGAIEIDYIAGQADRFWLRPKRRLMGKDVLFQLGLPTDVEPTFRNEFVTRWKGLEGLREVTLNPHGKGSPWVNSVLVTARMP